MSTPLLPGCRYRVSTEWEYNGPHDSDFYCVVWNDDRGELERWETGSTRYAAGPETGRSLVPMADVPESVWAKAEERYAVLFAERKSGLDALRCAEPGPRDVSHGTTVQLVRDVRAKGIKISAGAIGEVFWSGSYGTFYRRGYNKPDRTNTRIGIRLVDGTRHFVALSACKLAEVPISYEDALERGRSVASSRNFYPLFATSAVSLV